jgi:hypothetical protein
MVRLPKKSSGKTFAMNESLFCAIQKGRNTKDVKLSLIDVQAKTLNLTTAKEKSGVSALALKYAGKPGCDWKATPATSLLLLGSPRGKLELNISKD